MCCATADSILSEASSVIHIFTSDKLLQNKKFACKQTMQTSAHVIFQQRAIAALFLAQSVRRV